MSVKEQVHGKFKVFAGPLAADRSLGHLAQQVADFAKDKSAKSIGVEYLEGDKQLIVTLGYRDDETAYAVEVKTVSLGKHSVSASSLQKLEEDMAKASKTVGAVICHEIYVTDEHDFEMVFLIKK
jgi:hypothetical protein